MTNLDAAEIERRMDTTIEALMRALGGMRGGRAHPDLLTQLMVEIPGRPSVRIPHLGTISTPDPRLLTVKVWDRSAVKAVEQVIREQLDLNPQVEGQTIRVPLPELTKDRRQELSRLIHKEGEKAKVAIRNLRRNGMDHLKRMEKQSTISQNDHKQQSHHLQNLTDSHIQKIDAILIDKEKAIMQV